MSAAAAGGAGESGSCMGVRSPAGGSGAAIAYASVTTYPSLFASSVERVQVVPLSLSRSSIAVASSSGPSTNAGSSVACGPYPRLWRSRTIHHGTAPGPWSSAS